MKVIVSGKTYIDIDAYASGIAYAKYLRACGQEAVFAPMVSTNSSVCEEILKLGFKPDSQKFSKTDEFIVLDVSSPDFIHDFVLENNVVEVIDHHFGFKEYWNNRHVKNQIESIGAVATIIYERIVENGKAQLLSPSLCKLLIAAILDNTVNLTSDITSKRDIDAYHKLHEIGKVPYSFDREYFLSCQQYINDNIIQALQNDMKYDNSVNGLPGYFGQLLVYDKTPILNNLSNIIEFMNKKDSEWLINLICLEDNKSYLIAGGTNTKTDLEKLLEQKFESDIMTLPKPMLRKEIIKKSILYKNS